MAENKKQKLLYWLFLSILISASVLSGGIGWKFCIVPSVLMLVTILVTKKNLSLVCGISLCALVLLNGISIVTGIGDTQNAIYESEKMMCFIMAFIIGSYIDEPVKIAKSIFITGVLIASFGLLTYCNVVSFDEFVFTDYALRRLQSFIKYANVTASVLGCAYIACLELYVREQKNLYIGFGSMIAICMYLTFSKAFIPVFLLVTTIYLAKNKEITSLWLQQNFVAGVVAALVLIFEVKSLLLLAIIIATVLITGKRFNIPKSFMLWSIVLGSGILAAIVLIIFKPSILATLNVRLVYMHNACKLLKYNLITGTGPGSWAVMQYIVQITQYSVSYIHNGLLQLLVENGILYTGFFIVLICAAIVKSIKNKTYWVTCMMLYIIVHSMVDCELSFGYVLIVLGSLMGNSFNNCDIKHNTTEKIVLWLLILSFVCVNMYMLGEYFTRFSFEKSYLNGDIEKAKQQAEVLEKLCPYDSKLKVSLAALEEKSGNDEKIIQKYLVEAVKLAPYDATIYENYMLFNMSRENVSDMCRHYLTLARKQERAYIFAKDYTEKAFKYGYITEKEYETIINDIEKTRKKEKVKDRNEMLNQIVK